MATKRVENKQPRRANSGTFPKSTHGAGGPGWAGGPAKGASENRAPRAAAFEPGNKAAAGYHDMTRAQRLAKLDERKWMIGMGLVPTAMPVEMKAIDSYEDRHVGKVAQSVQLSGPEGGPIQSVGIATDDPVEAARAYQRIIRGQ